MDRQIRDARLETRNARTRLKQRHEPYWRLIESGLHLGYRKGPRGGVWIMRTYDGSAYQKQQLAKADDHQDSNGGDILSFAAAQKLAIEKHKVYKCQHGILQADLTVAQACERYLGWYREHRKAVKETEHVINTHILPAFGRKLARDLKTRELNEWLHKLAEQPPRRRTGQGKAQQFGDKPQTQDEKRARKSTANRILAVLKAILNKAFRDELVADDSVWRRVKPFEKVDEPVIRFLTDREATRLINTCRPDFRQLVKAALFTGARYSELTGLRVSDFDESNARIYIRPAKSGRGRHVFLNSEGLDFLSATCAGEAGGDYMFVRQDGEQWGKNHHIRLLQDACSKAKIEPAITFHDLRHTYASLLAQAGTDLLTISKLLGHADTRITSRHYAHMCDKTLSAAVQKGLPGFGHTPERKVRTLR